MMDGQSNYLTKLGSLRNPDAETLLQMWDQINLALFSLSVTPGQTEPAKYATYSLLLTTCNVFELLSINTNYGPNNVPGLRI
jgi:hypothetical protein